MISEGKEMDCVTKVMDNVIGNMSEIQVKYDFESCIYALDKVKLEAPEFD